MAHRTKRPDKRNENPPSKPEKPYPGFPLFAHASGQWAKKIRGKLYYFGVWAAPDEARERFEREWPYLKEGREPPPEGISQGGITIAELANEFLSSKDEKVRAGELSLRTFEDWFRTAETLVDHFGRSKRVDDLRPADFRRYRAKLAKRYGVHRLKNEINRTRGVLKFAFENALIEKPVRYGQEFDRPSAKQVRRHRNQSGKKLFSREEIHAMLEAAGTHLRAMILLGVNCGFGPSDCSNLPIGAVNLQTGWIDFPRPKTEIARRCPLWPETIEALRESLAKRPAPKSDEYRELCFLTRFGLPWERTQPKSDDPDKLVRIYSVGLEFGKLLRKLRIEGRKRRGHYTLRHTFQTQADEAKDPVATSHVMGHADNSMAGTYRESISDERLKAVVNTVREWLFADAEGGAA